MGLFVNYALKFAEECNQSLGFIPRSKIAECLANKTAIRRQGEYKHSDGDKKSAVIVVGVSCIGKSTYVGQFLKQNPGFVMLSYDDAAYQQEEERFAGKKVSGIRIIEILEEKLLRFQKQKIIVDSTSIDPGIRAALLRTLTDLGYETHLIYFSQKYTQENIGQRIRSRAIELVLFEDYCRRHDDMALKEIMEARENIVSISAKETNKSEGEIIKGTGILPQTRAKEKQLEALYRKELEDNRVSWQEKRGLFMLGADYYYEL